MSDDATAIIVLAVLGGPLLYLALRNRHRNKRDAQQLVDSRPPRELLDTLAFHMTQKGYAVAAKDDTTSTFTHQRRPSFETSVLMAVLALLSLLLQPILVVLPIAYFCYFWLGKPTGSTTVATRLTPGGTLVAFSGDDYKAREELRKQIREEDEVAPGGTR